MKTIIFYDPVCPKPYNTVSVFEGKLGGTEATVIRVALSLTKDYQVIIAQRAREERVSEKGISFINITDPLPKAHCIVTLRDAGYYVTNQKLQPNSKHYLWMHDVVNGDYRDHMLHHLEGQTAHLVCVSEWHKTQVIEALSPEIRHGRIRVNRIYPPLADYCVKTHSLYDKHKLVFFSSPHKGLEQVLHFFQMIRRIDAQFRLYISNPGYFDSATDLPDGVISLGILPHQEVIEQVRGSLCTLYPQNKFAETFGLVYAESNAVGTPVLAHRIGSASEVLEHPAQFVNCDDYKKVVDRVILWSNGERPILKGRPEFTKEIVAQEWKRLLD